MRPAPRAREPSVPASSRGGPRRADELIRLALWPDGEVAPDVRARAPGRGAWIGVDRATLEAAQAKGKLKAALARAFKTNAADAPDDLGARIEAALEKAALDRLGLEARAGTLVARLREDRDGGAARRSPAAAPRRRRERGRAAQARSGLARGSGRRRLGRAGLVLPVGPDHIVIGAGPRKCGTCRDHRPGRRGARDPRALRGGALLSDVRMG